MISQCGYSDMSRLWVKDGKLHYYLECMALAYKQIGQYQPLNMN